MLISRLEIEGFRGFNRNEVIDLDADVVMISGSNGSGKTSLLDAIQWLLLGDVTRLRPYSLRPTEDYVSNRYSSSPPYVSAEVRNESKQWTLRRRGFGKTSEFSIHDGASRLESKEADQMRLEIAGDSDTRFLRTFLLQQEEVREFLRTDPKERYEFLSQLAGLEDVQRLDDQLKNELRRLRESLRDEADRLDTERRRLEALQSELEESRAILERGHARGDEQEILARERLAELVEVPADRSGSWILRATAEAEALITQISSLSDAIQSHEEEAARALSELNQLTDESDLKARQLTIQRELARLERSLADREASARRLELQANEEMSRESALRQFAELALEQLGEVCPVCEQQYNKEHAVAHLQSLIKNKSLAATLREEARTHREEAAQLSTQTEALRASLVETEEALSDFEALRRRLTRERERARQAQEQLTNLLGGRWENASTAVRDLRNLAEGVGPSAIGVAEDIAGRVGVLEEEFTGERRRLGDSEQHLLRRRAVLQEAEETTKWLGDKLVEAASSVVRVTTPLINEIYSRLDVHPSLRRFDFKVDRYYQTGRLLPWVFDDERKIDGNAAQVLSAAQLNALAVCVFLALNLRQTWSPLKLIMLDDPVQSMDDVNVLGLADTFRSLRTYRQTFVSTHDSSLAKLLWRKLRPLKEGQRTLHVQLAEWTRDGPVVEAEAREAPPKPSELELVAS